MTSLNTIIITPFEFQTKTEIYLNVLYIIIYYTCLIIFESIYATTKGI